MKARAADRARLSNALDARPIQRRRSLPSIDGDDAPRRGSESSGFRCQLAEEANRAAVPTGPPKSVAVSIPSHHLRSGALPGRSTLRIQLLREGTELMGTSPNATPTRVPRYPRRQERD